MKEKLVNLLNNSYSPYSNYKVAAIVVMKDGKEFNGINVENVSYGATICAERVAILSAISAGYKKHDFESIYIMNSTEELGIPCFICRQVFLEFFESSNKVICMNINGEEKTYLISDLCPYPFNF